MSIPQHGLSSDFTVRSLADKLHVSERHVRECISQDIIPSYKVGRIRRIPAEAVEILRSGRTVDPADDDLSAQIKAIVDAAPKLTAAQKDKLAVLLADDEPEPKPKRRRTSRGNGVVR